MDYPSSVLHLLFDANEFLFAKNLVEMNSGMDPELKMVPTSITHLSVMDIQWGIFYLKPSQRWPSVNELIKQVLVRSKSQGCLMCH